MNCPATDDWSLLAMQALEDDQAAVLRAHALVCPACRETYAAARRDHTELARMYEAFDRDHDRRREQLLAALPDESASAPSRCVAPPAARLRGARVTQGVQLVKKHIVLTVSGSLGAAAALVLTILFVLHGGPRVDAATIFQNVREAAAKYRLIAIRCRNLPTTRAEEPAGGNADLVVYRSAKTGKCWYMMLYQSSVHPAAWNRVPRVL